MIQARPDVDWNYTSAQKVGSAGDQQYHQATTNNDALQLVTSIFPQNGAKIAGWLPPGRREFP
jgi:hypothetical protein